MERLAIVGSGLKIVEQVVGRLNVARAYDILADEEVAEDARTRLAQMAPPPLAPPPRPF